MEKQEWKKPNLEVLDVNQTMASAFNHNSLDGTYEAGRPFTDPMWGS